MHASLFFLLGISKVNLEIYLPTRKLETPGIWQHCPTLTTTSSLYFFSRVPGLRNLHRKQPSLAHQADTLSLRLLLCHYDEVSSPPQSDVTFLT